MESEELTDGEVRVIAEVIRTISEQEHDSDHIATLMGGYERLIELYGRAIWPEGDELIAENVELAIETLEQLAPTEEERERHKELYDVRHPDRCFQWVLEYVETEHKYVNGCLPDPEGGPVDG